MSPQKIFVINKTNYFYFLVFCLYTFNPLSLSLKWVMTLVATTCRNMERGKSCKITNMIRVRKETIYLHFQIEYCFAQFISGKRNCHGNWGMETKSSRRLGQMLWQSFIRCVRDINYILKKLYYMSFPCASAVLFQLIIEFRVFGVRFLNVFKYNLFSYLQQI